MTPQAQVFIAVLVIGIVVGGIAALSAKGRGLVLYIIIGVVGSFIGDPLLQALGVHLGDNEVGIMAGAIFGAIISVIVLRVIFSFVPERGSR